MATKASRQNMHEMCVFRLNVFELKVPDMYVFYISLSLVLGHSTEANLKKKNGNNPPFSCKISFGKL